MIQFILLQMLGFSTFGQTLNFSQYLVLAADVSGSVSSSEYNLQKMGLVEALRSPHLGDKIRRHCPGGISLAYVEWAAQAKVVIKWTPIRREHATDDLRRLSEQIERSPRAFKEGGTSISGAQIFSMELLAQELERDGSSSVKNTAIILSSDGIENSPAPENEGIKNLHQAFAKRKQFSPPVDVFGLILWDQEDIRGTGTGDLTLTYWREHVLQERQQTVADFLSSRAIPFFAFETYGVVLEKTMIEAIRCEFMGF